MPEVEVSFSPSLYEHKLIRENFITVIVDVLRATTSICAALDSRVSSIIPVSGMQAAKEMKQKGHLVACERDGIVPEFADIGNSPSCFLKKEFEGKEIVFSTTNGTQAVKKASDALQIVLGSFVNLSALSDWLIAQDRNVVIFCAGWKNLFNLEDSVFAGALSEKLIHEGKFSTRCDSVLAATDLWGIAGKDLYNYLSRSSHRNRLKHLVTESDYRYTVTIDTTKVIPVLVNGQFINASNREQS